MQPPPPRRPKPIIVTLPAGTCLWRVHLSSREVTEFNPTPTDSNFGGGRFDPTASDPFPFLYASFSPEGAITETLLRSHPFDAKGYRQVPRAKVKGRQLTGVKTLVAMHLLSLCTTADLAAVAQDEWLIRADPADYAATRAWGQWLRAAAPPAQGLLWHPLRNLSADLRDRVVLLYGDRVPGGVFEKHDGPIDLDSADGAAWLNELLGPWRARIEPPPRRKHPPAVKDDAASPPIISGKDVRDVEAPSTTAPGVPDEGEESLRDFEAFFKDRLQDIENVVHAVVLDRGVAADATQEAMLIAFRRWEHVGQLTNAVGYVITVAKRIAIGAVLRLSKERPTDPSRFPTPERPGIGPTDDPDQALKRLQLEEALRHLPQIKAAILMLHDYLGYKEREIADFLQIPLGTVKSRLHHARKELREHLGGAFGEGGNLR
ncbi:hypothetical protein GCM10022248_89840 [Nonomuraea soli]